MADVKGQIVDKREPVKVEKYGLITFARPANAQVFENRGGAKSTVIATATVPLGLIGLTVQASVYARLDPKGTIQPDAALPKGMGEHIDGSGDEFKDAISSALLTWTGYPTSFDAACERLTGQKIDRKRVVLPARLVKDGKVVTLPASA